MSAVLKESVDAASRARIVREIARIKAEGEKRGAQLATRVYQLRHDVELAREAVERARQAEQAADVEWGTYSRLTERAVSALEQELENTAPRAIDAAIAEIELTKAKLRNVTVVPTMVTMSDGSRQATPESKRDYEHNRDRWQTLLDAISELRRMKLEALAEPELRKRLDAIQGRIAAAMYLREG